MLTMMLMTAYKYYSCCLKLTYFDINKICLLGFAHLNYSVVDYSSHCAFSYQNVRQKIFLERIVYFLFGLKRWFSGRLWPGVFDSRRPLPETDIRRKNTNFWDQVFYSIQHSSLHWNIGLKLILLCKFNKHTWKY